MSIIDCFNKNSGAGHTTHARHARDRLFWLLSENIGSEIPLGVCGGAEAVLCMAISYLHSLFTSRFPERFSLCTPGKCRQWIICVTN